MERLSIRSDTVSIKDPVASCGSLDPHSIRRLGSKIDTQICHLGSLLAGILLLCIALTVLCGCAAHSEPKEDGWLESAGLDAVESPEELYEKALQEDVLIVYTVSTRVAQSKDSFEAAYPGLSVEVRDLRSPNLIEAVEENARSGSSECDVVLCNDNSGDFKSRLVDTGLVLPYLPSDIETHMKEGTTGEMVTFLSEAELLLYNSARYEHCPIDNLWALTDPVYKGRIFMPNPLRSLRADFYSLTSLQPLTEITPEKNCPFRPEAAPPRSSGHRQVKILFSPTAPMKSWKRYATTTLISGLAYRANFVLKRSATTWRRSIT